MSPINWEFRGLDFWQFFLWEVLGWERVKRRMEDHVMWAWMDETREFGTVND